MTDLERYLLTTLQQILELHKVQVIPPCACAQCKLARAGVETTEAELLRRASLPSIIESGR